MSNLNARIYHGSFSHMVLLGVSMYFHFIDCLVCFSVTCFLTLNSLRCSSTSKYHKTVKCE